MFEALKEGAPRAVALRTLLVYVTEYRMLLHCLDASSAQQCHRRDVAASISLLSCRTVASDIASPVGVAPGHPRAERAITFASRAISCAAAARLDVADACLRRCGAERVSGSRSARAIVPPRFLRGTAR